MSRRLGARVQQLPADLAELTGRTAELRTLHEVVADGEGTTVASMTGWLIDAHLVTMPLASATTCPPCSASTPVLSRQARDYVWRDPGHSWKGNSSLNVATLS